MFKKQSVEKGKFIKVTFYTHAIKEATTAFLVGDFNEWNETSHPMDKLKDGRFSIAIKVAPGKEYQFRYLINGEWHNDWEADKYVANPFSGDNSVVVATA